MSIYNTQKIKELAEEQLKKDLNSFGDDRPPILPNECVLDKEEFSMFLIAFSISKYSHTNDFFNHWTFFLSDDVTEEIILEDEELKRMYSEPYDFDIEECLEEAKSKHIIDGFCYLGNDLWLINEGDD